MIDACAFRCIEEYSNMVFIKRKFMGKNVMSETSDYLEELVRCASLDEIRKLHNIKMKKIISEIETLAEESVKKLKIGKKVKVDVVDEVIKKE
mgnify:CR=1 FL=1